MKNLIRAIVFLFILGGIGLSSAQAQNYDKAVGLKATGWGLGVTGKMFLNEEAAVDVGVTYRSFGAFSYSYSWTSIYGLYELHKDIDAVDGLQWYYGGGVFYTLYGGDFDYAGSGLDNFFGLSGVLGLDYKFENTPISITLDWIPSFGFGGYGFGADNGGVAVRYTF